MQGRISTASARACFCADAKLCRPQSATAGERCVSCRHCPIFCSFSVRHSTKPKPGSRESAGRWRQWAHGHAGELLGTLTRAERAERAAPASDVTPPLDGRALEHGLWGQRSSNRRRLCAEARQSGEPRPRSGRPSPSLRKQRPPVVASARHPARRGLTRDPADCRVTRGARRAAHRPSGSRSIRTAACRGHTTWSSFWARAALATPISFATERPARRSPSSSSSGRSPKSCSPTSCVRSG